MDVLCCRITVGDPDPDNPMKILNGVEMTEVHTIEINESYKKLIGTAKVTFPKGSVCRSTIIGNITLEGKDASRLTTKSWKTECSSRSARPSALWTRRLSNWTAYQYQVGL